MNDLVEEGLKLLYDGNTTACVQLLEKEVAKNERNVDALSLLAEGYFVLGELSKAEETFLKCIDVEPERPTGYFGVGLTSFENGNFSTSEEYYSVGMSFSPNDSKALSRQCWMLLEKGLISTDVALKNFE